MQIEGFLDMLHDQVKRHGSCCVLPRLISQDSLESFFGSLRYACGSGNHPELLKVINAVLAVEAQREARKRTTSEKKRKQNSGISDERATKLQKLTSFQKVRSTVKREAAAEAIGDACAPKQQRWHMKEPEGFDAGWLAWQQRPHSSAQTVIHDVKWTTLKAIQVRTIAKVRFFRRSPDTQLSIYTRSMTLTLTIGYLYSAGATLIRRNGTRKSTLVASCCISSRRRTSSAPASTA